MEEEEKPEVKTEGKEETGAEPSIVPLDIKTIATLKEFQRELMLIQGSIKLMLDTVLNVKGLKDAYIISQDGKALIKAPMPEEPGKKDPENNRGNGV